MLKFEITKTNTSLPQKGLAPILIAPPHTYVRQWLFLWNKAKPMWLTYREETKQPLRPIAGLPAPWVLSSAGKLIRYLHGSYFLPYCNTVSTPDASGAARQNTIELDAAPQQIPDSKLLPRSIYDILTQISNDFQRLLCRFVQCRQTATVFRCRKRCKPSFVPQTFSPFVFYPPSLSFCRRSANVRHVHWWALSLASWVDTPLTADWLQVCFGARPDSFSKAFLKKCIPHL